MKAVFITLAVLLLAAGCSSTKRNVETPIPPPLLQTLPNTEKSWLQYRNEQLGFEVKYPPDWFVEECRLNDVIIGNDQIGSYHCGDAGPPLDGDSIIDTEGVTEIRLTNYADVASAIKDYMQNFENASQEPITVAGIPAVQLQGIARQSVLGNYPQETIVFVSHNGKVFVLMNDVQNKAYKDTFYSILSTLKFTY
jgi:hypothetical protein